MRNRRNLPRLTWLQAFEATARHLSQSAAARELNVTPAAVSQLIKQLEHFLDTKLFERQARGLALTPAGAAYLPVVRNAFDLLDTGTTELFDKTSEPLHIRSAPTFSALWLGPRLRGFAELAPDVDVRLSTVSSDVNHDRDGVDVEIRLGDRDQSRRWPGVVATPLAEEYFFPVCSPALLPKLGSPADLVQTPLLQVRGIRDGWSRWLEQAGVEHPRPHGGYSFDVSLAAVEAAVHGVGVVLGRTFFVSHHLRAGRLVVPFEGVLKAEETHYMVCTPKNDERPMVRSFQSWLVAQIELEHGGLPRQVSAPSA